MTSENESARVQNLVLMASAGDQQAFGDLYEMYLDRIYRYVYFRVRNQQDVEDLTETSFVKAWQVMHSNKKPIRNFNAWIYRITQNLITDYFRKKKPLLMDEISAKLKTNQNNTEDKLIQDDDFAELAKALQRIDERSSQIIRLRFLSQLSHAETAAVMGLEEGHVRVLQHRALQKLRAEFVKDSENG